MKMKIQIWRGIAIFAILFATSVSASADAVVDWNANRRGRSNGSRQRLRIVDSARLSAKIVKDATLKVYSGAPHGMCSTHKDQVNADLLAFIQGEKSAAA